MKDEGESTNEQKTTVQPCRNNNQAEIRQKKKLFYNELYLLKLSKFFEKLNETQTNHVNKLLKEVIITYLR